MWRELRIMVRGWVLCIFGAVALGGCERPRMVLVPYGDGVMSRWHESVPEPFDARSRRSIQAATQRTALAVRTGARRQQQLAALWQRPARVLRFEDEVVHVGAGPGDAPQVERPQAAAWGEPRAEAAGAVHRAEAGQRAGAGQGAVDPNTATEAELTSLPRIGPSLAARIVAHRPFASVDELVRVPGIGPATLERLRPHVAVR